MSEKKIESREIFQRHLSSIGVVAQVFAKSSSCNNNFETLKRNRMKLMGKVLRNSSREVEFFSLRDQNAKRRSIQHQRACSEEPQFLLSDFGLEEQVQVSGIECQKCQRSLSRVVIQQPQLEMLLLKKPILAQSVERQSRRELEQVHLSAHQAIKRSNLPPILFQAHLKEPSGGMVQSVSFRKESRTIPGKILFGRIAEGIDEEYLELLAKQKLLQQAKVPKKKKKKYSLKCVNLFKSKTSGNVLGKAISRMKASDGEEEEQQKRAEREMIREKERQIDELIFSRKSEEFLEMKDFL